MFGSGKKKKEAEEEIEFAFDDEGDLPPEEGEETPSLMKGEGPSAGGPRPGLPRRTAVLAAVFLLLAIGGGAYYYLMLSAPEPPPAPAPVKKTVAVKPAPAAAPAPAAQPAATAPPAAGKPAASAPVAPPATAKAPQEVKPAAATPVQGKEEKKPAPPAAAGKPAVPAAVATAPATAEAKPAAGTVTPPAPRGGAFTLVAGTFLNAEHQRDVERKIRKLGFKPQVRTLYRNVPMTRLRLGVYDAATAAARRKELAGQIPELFSLKQGNKVALYAGSYQDLDQARSFADKLYLRNIHVEEEQAQLRMPLKTISFGSFANRSAAQQAAKRAAKAGLAADVVKR